LNTLLGFWLRACAATVLLYALTGCSSAPPTAPVQRADDWSGRLALQVEDDPPQSFSAAFDLRGSAIAGELWLYSPLGSTLAKLSWSSGMARLEQGESIRESRSLDSLLRELTGQPLPIAALFDWLHGNPSPATGWQADLHAAPEGRIIATRTQPLPRATLRIALSR
jgi:outer membrane lipoprotein LolB